MDGLTRRQMLCGTGVTALAMASSAKTSPTSAARPGVLNAHSGSWDSKRRAALVFGGADERRVLGDLWQFRDSRWNRLSGSGPSPRTFPAVVYDSARDRLVVFGGNRVLFGDGSTADTLLGDHWEWDGRRWHQYAGLRPPERTEAACAFDATRGRTILFGGWRWQDGKRLRLGDLWEFDGRRWHRSAALGPEPRSGAAMTYDSKRRQILLAGGNGPRNDLWSLKGDQWRRLTDLPQARFNPAIAFDRLRDQVVLFGGWTGKERIAATSLFDGTAWHRAEGLEPSARNHSLLVPIDDGSRLLLLGGHTGLDPLLILGDAWEWSGAWHQRYSTLPVPRLENGH